METASCILFFLLSSIRLTAVHPSNDGASASGCDYEVWTRVIARSIAPARERPSMAPMKQCPRVKSVTCMLVGYLMVQQFGLLVICPWL